MINFSDALNRLKHTLRVSKDQEVATLLGMKKTTFAERKRRGVFPDREVIALSRSRPELELDIDFIFTGESKAASKTEVGLAGARAMQKLQAGTETIMRGAIALGYEPPMIWTALIQELMFSHGLTEAGALRVMETLKSEKRDQV